jgi:MYXO-CTERM domain-containing protein
MLHFAYTRRVENAELLQASAGVVLATTGCMKTRALFTLSLSTWVLLATGVARAATTEVGPSDDVEAAINALQPGDELVLQGGDYTLTDAWHISVAGTAAQPIVIRAKDGEVPHLNRPGVDQNIIDFDDVEYLEIRGIRFSGGSAGLRFSQASFVTVEDCEVFDTDDVAIRANDGGSDYEGLKIIHNHIHHTNGTGEGMYIGCNDNGCQVHDSLFAGNYIHHTNGPNVTQGDGIEIKEGSYANVIRDNVIHDTGYPCILTYSTVGNGAPNVIERNVMWGCGDHAIQAAADVVIRNNIILGAAANGIANQAHQAGTPSNIQILFNTVLNANGDAISSSGITGSVLIANNAVYSQNGNAIRVTGSLGSVTVVGNVGEGALDGVSSGLATGSLANDFVGASYGNSVPNDVFPKAGSALIAAGDTGHMVDDDFNGTLRNGVADVGAYVFAASNPGWTLGEGFKDETPVTGGTGGTGGTGTGGSATGGSATGGSATGGSGNAGNGGSGANAGSAGSGAGGGSDDDGGCGCRTAERSSGASAWLALALALGLARRRFRQGA